MKTKRWDEEIKIDSISYPADKLNRKTDADLLTKVLLNRYESGKEQSNKSSYVLNLNAEWGAGKTYFVRRWCEDLKQNHPVVYIDAWANDFMDSPVITVLSEIKEQLLESIDQRKVTAPAKLRLKNIGYSVLPKILAALVKRYGGFDINELLEEDSTSQKTETESKELDLSKAMEAMASQAFTEYSQYKEGVKTLKKTIKELMKYSIDNPKENLVALKRDYPVFVFIDELDRCRPTYAVEMLEAIKHIFDIEGLVIVVSTHTEELQHTIKVLYGNDFNADDYLRRFFHAKYHLNVHLSEELIKANCDLRSIDPNCFTEKSIVLFPVVQNLKYQDPDSYRDSIVKIVAKVANWMELSPRSAIQLTERLIVCIELLENGKSYDIILISYLLAMYMFDYNRAYEPVSSKIISEGTNFYIGKNQEQYLFDKFQTKLGISLTELSSELIQLHDLSKTLDQWYYCHNRNQRVIDYDSESALRGLSQASAQLTISNYFDIVLGLENVDFDTGLSLRRLVDYDGRGDMEAKAGAKYMMLYYGLANTRLNEYIELIELSSKFRENTL
ncbi:KAP family P-loop NTPase fold protein [Pseudoalteromonas luteoviolacea]|uniref:KAP NTPase domain-containing protein n=1 Tax=Pseudoalteromonas luteoviolacea S4060-1 TaxID=1365257 RepID=A0A167JQS0_9GAMM|nr:P-loop NTPase fold protein [Pseudoalteromonas luteoviolacea]KZN61522.1 hypothetical protein N478_05465 [Pseudoalteromonas luteoviolacea S4060-1]